MKPIRLHISKTNFGTSQRWVQCSDNYSTVNQKRDLEVKMKQIHPKSCQFQSQGCHLCIFGLSASASFSSIQFFEKILARFRKEQSCYFCTVCTNPVDEKSGKLANLSGRSLFSDIGVQIYKHTTTLKYLLSILGLGWGPLRLNSASQQLSFIRMCLWNLQFNWPPKKREICFRPSGIFKWPYFGNKKKIFEIRCSTVHNVSQSSQNMPL